MAEAEESLAVDPQVEEVNDTDDEVIWPLQEVKRRRVTHFPLPGVLGIFPDLSPAKLCELVDFEGGVSLQGISHRAYRYGGATMRLLQTREVFLNPM